MFHLYKAYKFEDDQAIGVVLRFSRDQVQVRIFCD